MAIDSAHSSVYVAPLALGNSRSRSRGTSEASQHTRKTSSRASHRTAASTSSHSQMTPPATPNGSQEDLNQHLEPPQPVFHNFLRAFYPFHPTYAISDTTVTLPLSEGDVILVHSIHTDGLMAPFLYPAPEDGCQRTIAKHTNLIRSEIC